MFVYLTVNEFLNITSFPEKVDRLTLKNEFVEDHLEIITESQLFQVVKQCIKQQINKIVFIGLSFLQIFNWEKDEKSKLFESDLFKQFKPLALEFHSCDGTIPFIKNLRNTGIWNKSLKFLLVKNTNPFDDTVEREIILWLKDNHRFVDVKYIPRVLYSSDINKTDCIVQHFDKEICSYLTRNAESSNACGRGCIALLMIWKYRRGESGLSLIDKNLILRIIQILWSDFYVKPDLIKQIAN